MLALTKQNKEVHIRLLNNSDFDRLMQYLHSLRAETVQRFQPHSFEPQDVLDFYQQQGTEACVAIDTVTDEMVGYAVLKKGLLQHDVPRLQQYQQPLQYDAAYTFAPSVKDDWQSTGIGQLMMNFVRAETQRRNVRQLVLWGGVQVSNEKAVRFYRKNGFQSLGYFEYNGLNEDMLLGIQEAV
jgi:diamine N-acetyltransferase